MHPVDSLFVLSGTVSEFSVLPTVFCERGECLSKDSTMCRYYYLV